MNESHELLREILFELRKLRRQVDDQAEHLETLKAIAWEEAEASTRQRISERNSKVQSKATAHLRRVLPSQRPLVDWLRNRGFEFLNFKRFPLVRGPADELAVELSSSYELLEPLVKALLASVTYKHGTNFSLARFPQPQASAIASFAQKLEDLGLVAAMNFVKDQAALFIEPHDDGVMNNFLSGGWLELRVEHLVAEMHPLWKPGRCLQNVQLKGPEGGDFELDLFLATDGDPLHLECKSGDISQAIPKVARTVEALGLPPSRNFVVVPTLDPEAKARWQTKCPATFVALCDLPSCIAEFLPQAAQS